jgi:hypothetical protein
MLTGMVKKDRSFLLNAMEDEKPIGLREFVRKKKDL